MSFPYDNSFQGQPGADDSNAQGVAGGQPQPQMGQPIESAAGQFQGGNMPVGAPNAAQPGPGGEAKTTLWMGELEPWIDENFIRSVWFGMGEQVNVKMIRDKFSGNNAGYCFVDFQTPEAAAKALSLNGQMIPNTNRPFKLNWASGGGLADRRDDRGPEYSIFVGDLGPEVNEYVLVSLFQNKYPSCKSAKIMTDPISGMSRGYGFVRFSEESEQQRALNEMQGVYCGNRPMRISTATPKNKSGGGPAGAGGPMGGGMHGPGPVGMYGMGAPPLGYYGAPQPMNQFTDPNNTTVFVGGLSGYVTEDELRSFFQGFGEITYVKIPPGKGCGFVQFVQRHAAEMAINQMQGYPIGNSRVRLSWGRSQNNSGPAGTPYRPAPPPPVYPNMGMPGPYGGFAPMNMYMAAAAMPPPPPPPPPSFPPPSMQPMARYCALPFPPSATALTTSLSTPQSPITMASLSQHDLAESLHRMSLGNGNASAMTATSGNGTGARSTTDLKSEGNEQVTDKVKGHEKRDSVQRSGSDSMALPTSMGILGVIGRGARGGDL